MVAAIVRGYAPRAGKSAGTNDWPLFDLKQLLVSIRSDEHRAYDRSEQFLLSSTNISPELTGNRSCRRRPLGPDLMVVGIK